MTEREGGLFVNWDAVEELFPAGVLDGMFGAFVGLVEWLGVGDWSGGVPSLVPGGQVVVRERVNATAGPVSGRLLHEGFFECARVSPDAVALVWGSGGVLTYGELASRALGLAGVLAGSGVGPGDAVGVSLPKGPDQVVAVLGVLAVGGVYVPVGVDQPVVRRERILSRAGVRGVVCADGGVGVPAGVAVVAPDAWVCGGGLAGPVGVADESAAYVIFTSGSTGEPKGVVVSHRAAVNTVEDVCSRFGVGVSDRVLAVSALDFDLSVFDVFGVLGVGGGVVLVEEGQRRDAGAWLDLVRRHHVT
ncbi:AMP-binding protein, partial [Sphaerimonospora mesophila]|uniref:AMP-binding protein n=1 Tax=Sphaerimonospora mesophila TaxID=37483 RepID=UPI001F364C96